VVDLQLDYNRLHELANDARTLKTHLNDTVPGMAGTETVPGADSSYTGTSFDGYYASKGSYSSTEVLGSSKVSAALLRFHTAWEKPFTDAMDRLGEFANLLDGVATKFFDMDADFAQKAASVLSQQTMLDWQAAEAAYLRYLKTRDMMFTPYPLYNEDGVLEAQEPVPLFDYKPENIPEEPGPMPDSSEYNSYGNDTSTDTEYDDNGRVASETTTVDADSGLGYTQTTEYTYTGDSPNPTTVTTTITHSDGTVSTVVTTYADKYSYESESTTVSPDGETSSSTTTVTVDTETIDDGTEDGKTVQLGYTAVTVDEDGETTTVVAVNNEGIDADTKTVTDEDGTVRVYKGNYDADSWEQVSGPGEFED